MQQTIESIVRLQFDTIVGSSCDSNNLDQFVEDNFSNQKHNSSISQLKKMSLSDMSDVNLRHYLSDTIISTRKCTEQQNLLFILRAEKSPKKKRQISSNQNANQQKQQTVQNLYYPNRVINFPSSQIPHHPHHDSKPHYENNFMTNTSTTTQWAPEYGLTYTSFDTKNRQL